MPQSGAARKSMMKKPMKHAKKMKVKKSKSGKKGY